MEEEENFVSTEGSTFKQEIKLAGDPNNKFTKTITWKKDDEDLQDHISGDKLTLQLDAVTREDAGTYTVNVAYSKKISKRAAVVNQPTDFGLEFVLKVKGKGHLSKQHVLINNHSKII